MRTSIVPKVVFTLAGLSVSTRAQEPPTPESAESKPAPPMAASTQAPPASVPPRSHLQVEVLREKRFENRLAFNYLSLVVGYVTLEYQHAITESVTLDAAPSLVMGSLLGSIASRPPYAADFAVGASYFWNGHGLEGPFLRGALGPVVVWEGEDNRKGTFLGGRALIGYHWIGDSGWTLGASAGIQSTPVLLKQLPLPTFDLDVGYAF